MGLLIFLGRTFLALLIAALVLFAMVGVVTLESKSHCQSLIADGWSVVAIMGNCYAEVGDGMYMPIYNEGQPKTIDQIIAEKTLKQERAFSFWKPRE